MQQTKWISLLLFFSYFLLPAQSVVIQFNTPLTTTPTVAKAALRYDKDFAYSFTLDDGNLDVFTCGFPALMGGTVQGQTYAGLYFTDGCGNNIPFRGGVALNAANFYGQDSHDGGTPNKITWTQLDSLYGLCWDVFNHSFSHKAKAVMSMTYSDYVNEILLNRAAILEKSAHKIQTPTFVVPSGDTTYQSTAYAQGESIVFDQAGNTIGFGGIHVNTPFLANGRTVNRQDLESNILHGLDFIGTVGAQASPTDKIWYNEFAHGLSNFDANAGFNFYKFRNYMARIANTWGKNGSDRLWMAPLQEVYEYQLMRQFAHYTTTVNNNQMVLNFDLNNVPSWLRRKSLTLVVNSSIDFSSVEVPSNVKMTFRGTGAHKIINLEFLDSIVFNPCSTDVQPPVLRNCPSNISVTSTGTNATATWTAPTATDNCTTTPSVTSNLISGATFPIGTTTVIYTAKDTKGNTSTCHFTVTVSKTLSSLADLALSLSADVRTYQPYKKVNYTLLLENKSAAAMKDIKIEFPYPLNTANGGAVVPSIGLWHEFCPGNIACYQWAITMLNAHATATLNVPLFMNESTAAVVVTVKLLASTPTDGIVNNNMDTITLLPFTALRAAQVLQKPTQFIPVVIQTISPNPTDGEVVIDLESIVEKEVVFHFSNTLGKTVRTEKRVVAKGRNRLLFDFWNAESGVYFIQIEEPKGRNRPVRFVKL